MSLITYDPWSLLNQLQGEVNRLFENRLPSQRDRDNSTVATSQWIPAVDIKEEEQRFLIMVDLPGIDPKAIEVSMENNVLTIKGERQMETKEQQDNFSRIERAYGSFYRKFTLPDTADGEHISAQSHNGVLNISIPKKEVAKPRKINVHIEQDKDQKALP